MNIHRGRACTYLVRLSHTLRKAPQCISSVGNISCFDGCRELLCIFKPPTPSRRQANEIAREKETGRKHLETVRRHHSFFFSSRASLSHRGGLCAPQASNGHVTMSENIAPGVNVCNWLCLVYSAAQPARTGYNRSYGRTETKPRAGAVIQGRSMRRRRRRRSEVSSW